MPTAAGIKTFFFYVLITAFFAFLSYQLVLWFRQNVSWRSYVVQSGSMEPSIMTGDMIIIKKQEKYQKADVITFKDDNERTVTHRVTEVGTSQPITLTTKGDANETADAGTIKLEQVIGKVVYVIPKFGYVVQFIKTPWGFILTILVPAILILYDESKSVWADSQGGRKGRRRRIEQ